MRKEEKRVIEFFSFFCLHFVVVCAVSYKKSVTEVLRVQSALKFCYNYIMNTKEKIKRITLIALGFALATYLIMSGVAILHESS